MAGTGPRLRLRALRWVLPLMLAFGICLMHTLGHLATDHGDASHSGAVAHEVMVADTMMPGMAAVEFFADAGSQPMFDPMSTCLAVLTSLLVLLLSLASARTVRRPARSGGGVARGSGVARSPPRRSALNLSELSVMRI